MSESANLVLIVVAASCSLIWKWIDETETRHRELCDEFIPRLDRIVELLEAQHAPSSPPRTAQAADLSTVSVAIAEGRWDVAKAVLDDHPDHPDATRLAAKLESARENTSADLHAQLEAAKAVTDPARVLELRDKLAEVIAPELLKTLDSELAKWFMPVIMKRLRTGSVGPEVPELAGQVADRFAGTMEGASLRASLPTLRRSAGLCPKCSKPYRGISEACPACMLNAQITAAPPDTDAEAEEVEKLTRPEESPFLDLDADL